MFWLQIVSNFIKILREGQTPAQVAGGFALGSIVGLSPALTLQGLLVWFLILILNVNLSAALLSFTLFALVAFLLDPLFHQLGYYLLTEVEALTPLWTSLYNAPLAPLTRFNNTLVLGSLVGAFVLFVPVYVAMKKFVVAYRANIGQRVAQWKVYRAISASPLFQWYRRIRDFGGPS